MTEQNEQQPPIAGAGVDIWSRTIVALLIGILVGSVVSLTGLSTLADHLLPLIVGFVVFVLFMAGISFILVQNKEKILHKLFGVSDTDLTDVKDNAQQLFLNSWKREFPAARENFNAVFNKIFAWYTWMSFRRWILMVFQMLFVGGVRSVTHRLIDFGLSELVISAKVGDFGAKDVGRTVKPGNVDRNDGVDVRKELRPFLLFLRRRCDELRSVKEDGE